MLSGVFFLLFSLSFLTSQCSCNGLGSREAACLCHSLFVYVPILSPAYMAVELCMYTIAGVNAVLPAKVTRTEIPKEQVSFCWTTRV